MNKRSSTFSFLYISSSSIIMHLKLLTISTEHGGRIHLWLDSMTLVSEDMNLEDLEGERHPSAIDNEHLKTLVEQNPH